MFWYPSIASGRESARLRWQAAAGVCAVLLLGAVTPGHSAEPDKAAKPVTRMVAGNGSDMTAATDQKAPAVRFEPVTFAELAGWEHDDHLAAFRAFESSCRALKRVAGGEVPGKAKPALGLAEACAAAREKPPRTRAAARSFFETVFVPHRVVHEGPDGLLTGYYEPLVAGSRVATERFRTPVFRRPPDLVNLVDESQRGAAAGALTHARSGPQGVEPYATRAEIEAGSLAGQGLELMYFENPVDVFFMQVQGSARVELPGGELVRITYDGKNGHAYTSIGRRLIERGEMREDEMSLAALARWLKADPERARATMLENKSYVFFRELGGAEADAAMGVFRIPLTPGRSLAVDAGHHGIGTPVWVSSAELKHAGSGKSQGGFARLMIAHDVGSAIRGPERGDIFFGSGMAAGRKAGVTKHPGRFIVLLPKAAGPAIEASPAGVARVRLGQQ